MFKLIKIKVSGLVTQKEMVLLVFSSKYGSFVKIKHTFYFFASAVGITTGTKICGLTNTITLKIEDIFLQGAMKL